MANFQDARDGLAKLIKDTAGKLNPDERDKIIQDAVKQFSRRVPRRVAAEISGTGGFDYALSLLTGFVENVSRVETIFHPYSADTQNPEQLEEKDWVLFQKAAGKVLRFLTASPGLNTTALVQYTVPHTASPLGVDVIGSLSPAGTIIAGPATSSVVDVESAADGRIFVNVSAGAGGVLDVFIQISEDGLAWSDISVFNGIVAPGNFVYKLSKEKLSKNVRLRYAVTAGSFTLEANVERENQIGTLTVLDDHIDILSLLSASLAARALANFYAGTSEGTLEGDTTEYTGKSQFWGERADEWAEKFDEEVEKVSFNEELPTSAIGEWDLLGSTGFRPMLHHPRHR